MSKTNYPLENISWEKIETLALNIGKRITEDNLDVDLIVPIIRGGMPLAMLLSSILDVSEMCCIHIRRSVDDRPNTEFAEPVLKGITNKEKIKDANILIVDDTLDSKVTLDYAIKELEKYKPKSINVAILYNFNKKTFEHIYSGEEVTKYKWVVFPWEEKQL